uniref:Uncharacterized protein n=1 Tax=Romanomermis culicivorax TaxID=13658 RepID=A0A915ID08_ROMCU
MKNNRIVIFRPPDTVGEALQSARRQTYFISRPIPKKDKCRTRHSQIRLAPTSVIETNDGTYPLCCIVIFRSIRIRLRDVEDFDNDCDRCSLIKNLHIDRKVLAIILAGVSHLKTWQTNRLVDKFRAIYAKSLQQATCKQALPYSVETPADEGLTRNMLASSKWLGRSCKLGPRAQKNIYLTNLEVSTFRFVVVCLYPFSSTTTGRSSIFVSQLLSVLATTARGKVDGY